MTARDFCYWLQGFFEIQTANGGKNPVLDETQTGIIARHLALVFAHDIDPQAGPKSVQDKLNKIHQGLDPNVIYRC